MADLRRYMSEETKKDARYPLVSKPAGVQFGSEFLSQPKKEMQKLKNLIYKEEELRTRLYGSALNYSNPWGCKIQTTTTNYQEDLLVKLGDIEKEIEKQAMVFYSSYFSFNTLIDRMVEGRNHKPYIEKAAKILKAYYNPFKEKTPTFREVAHITGYSVSYVYNNLIDAQKYALAEYKFIAKQAS